MNNSFVLCLLLAQAAFVLGVSSAIIVIYIRFWRASLWLSHHIVLMALSYIVLIGLTLLTIYEIQLPPWRVALKMVAYGTGDYSLLAMLHYGLLKRRLYEADIHRGS